jgi:cytochrome c peroxidase
VLIGAFSFINPDYATAIARIKAIPGYADLFRKEFPGDPDPVTPDNWAKAIGAFERTLVTPSRFDAFLAGDAHRHFAARKRQRHQRLAICRFAESRRVLSRNTNRAFALLRQ